LGAAPILVDERREIFQWGIIYASDLFYEHTVEDEEEITAIQVGHLGVAGSLTFAFLFIDFFPEFAVYLFALYVTDYLSEVCVGACVKHFVDGFIGHGMSP
jgi:hypothetical protein